MLTTQAAASTASAMPSPLLMLLLPPRADPGLHMGGLSAVVVSGSLITYPGSHPPMTRWRTLESQAGEGGGR
jgi:hypothetical protein